MTYGVSIAPPVFHDGIVFVTGYWEGAKAIKLGEKPTDAEVIWTEAKKLRGLMSQFVAQLNEADAGPLARAVVGHWAFVHLHPFKDGNGRVTTYHSIGELASSGEYRNGKEEGYWFGKYENGKMLFL